MTISARDWESYLQRFHHERPGITEDVLAHATDEGTRPYDWAAEAVRDGPVLDIACGSGPLAAGLKDRRWVGIDVSGAELAAARDQGAVTVVRAHAGSVPLASGSVGSVVCSMALMLVQPLDDVVSEVARVLQPGGAFVALLPSRGPLTPTDAARYTRLLAALRTRHLDYPNDALLGDIGSLVRRHGLRLVEDERRRFCCRITTPSVGVMCVRSLYLPDIDPSRLAAGERVASGWIGKQLGLPLRRLVSVRGSDGER